MPVNIQGSQTNPRNLLLDLHGVAKPPYAGLEEGNADVSYSANYVCAA